jgi:hypothetical protein
MHTHNLLERSDTTLGRQKERAIEEEEEERKRKQEELEKESAVFVVFVRRPSPFLLLISTVIMIR